MVMSAEPHDDFTVVPPVDELGRYVVDAEVATITPGYGRLLPMLNVFRLDKRYDLREHNYPPGGSQIGIYALKKIAVWGPWTPEMIEERFVLPEDLVFRRTSEYRVVIRDPDLEPNSYGTAEVELEFRPPRTKWWQTSKPWDGK
jgi:hypothetical protein